MLRCDLRVACPVELPLLGVVVRAVLLLRLRGGGSLGGTGRRRTGVGIARTPGRRRIPTGGVGVATLLLRDKVGRGCLSREEMRG